MASSQPEHRHSVLHDAMNRKVARHHQMDKTVILGPWTKPLARQWHLWLASGTDLYVVHLAVSISV
jgi:hypothetical protein